MPREGCRSSPGNRYDVLLADRKEDLGGDPTVSPSSTHSAWVKGVSGPDDCLLMTRLVSVTWAVSVKKFFEPTVCVQTDRGHKVIVGGPHAIVRHPGYFSGFLVFIGMPVSLGSMRALIPAILLCLLLVLRTIWEERTLRDELAEYEEYTQRVRYRLIPAVW
jgi:protein-S-isoprenylcysteine O-methyltransferase Ste14